MRKPGRPAAFPLVILEIRGGIRVGIGVGQAPGRWCLQISRVVLTLNPCLLQLPSLPCSPVLNLRIVLCVFCTCLSYSEMLAFTLTAFLELMDHGIVSWDMVSITFIKQVRLPTFLPQSPGVL